MSTNHMNISTHSPFGSLTRLPTLLHSAQACAPHSDSRIKPPRLSAAEMTQQHTETRNSLMG
jgi:hypothetical protein